MVKPVKFTRDSGCLALDEFLVIFKGDNILIYTYIFAIVFTVEHCIAQPYVVCVGTSSLELIKLNFTITFQNHIMFCRTVI